MGGWERFVDNFSRWYDAANARYEARKLMQAPAREHWSHHAQAFWALLAVLGWMRGVVVFPEIGAWRCPKL